MTSSSNAKIFRGLLEKLSGPGDLEVLIWRSAGKTFKVSTRKQSGTFIGSLT